MVSLCFCVPQLVSLGRISQPKADKVKTSFMLLHDTLKRYVFFLSFMKLVMFVSFQSCLTVNMLRKEEVSCFFRQNVLN